MQSNSLLFAGADVSSGRNPITFAALDEDRNITILEKRDVPEVLLSLQEYKHIWLAVSRSSAKAAQHIYADFKEQIVQTGFKTLSNKENQKNWFETDAQSCYRKWIGQNPLPRRSLEGRLQRALILYEQGLRIEDPMDIFEEITRYKLIKGIFRLENIYSSKQLDALAAAHLAWSSVNRPERIAAQGEFVLPVQE